MSSKVRTYLNFVNGQWTPSKSGKTASSVNPANKHEIVGHYQLSEAEDLNKATEAAKHAARGWARMSGAARGDILFKAAQILESNIEDIAETMTREMGKTLPEAKGETARGVALLRYYAGEGMRKVGDVIPSSDADALMYTTRVPLGVVGIITPWNFPVAIPIWKIAPALIYGNAIVFKPASDSVITAAKVVECLAEAGLPAGVLNMVSGSGSVVGQGMIDHPQITGISFTGSDATGKRVAVGAASRGAKYQLEMGGKNPVIIMDDADLELAVDGTISGAFRSTGQKCTATSRVMVQSGIYEAFRARLTEKVNELNIGDGLEQNTWMGPCASESQLDTVLSYIEKGKAEGAKLLVGGNRLTGNGFENGFYVEPTIFDQVESKMTIAQEEIFGPVIALIPFETADEAFELANDTPFGLSASIYTKDIEAMLGFIREVDAGLVRINAETAGVELQAPFGGMKMSSSHSREQGQAAIEFYTAIKTVFVKS